MIEIVAVRWGQQLDRRYLTKHTFLVFPDGSRARVAKGTGLPIVSGAWCIYTDGPHYLPNSCASMRHGGSGGHIDAWYMVPITNPYGLSPEEHRKLLDEFETALPDWTQQAAVRQAAEAAEAAEADRRACIRELERASQCEMSRKYNGAQSKTWSEEVSRRLEARRSLFEVTIGCASEED